MKTILSVITCTLLFGASLLSYGQNQSPAKGKENVLMFEYSAPNGIMGQRAAPLGIAAIGDTIFYETFGNGLSGDAGNGMWATNGKDYNGVNDPNALWEYRGVSTIPDNTFGSRGAYEASHLPILSPTVSNGFFIFDSDYLDNGGVQGAFGAGTSPSPHESWLVSPSFSTIGYNSLRLSLNVYCRRFQGETYVLLSNDDGQTWGDSILIWGFENGVSFATEKDSKLYLSVDYLANFSNCKVALYFDGITNGDGYYFSMVDDLLITESPDNDLILEEINWNALSGSSLLTYYTQIPSHVADADTISLIGSFSNIGKNDQTNTYVLSSISHPNGSVVLSSDSINSSTSTSGNLEINTPFILNEGIGTYQFAFSIASDSVDDFPENNALDTMSIEVTDSTYARDINASGNYWTGPGNTYEIGNMFHVLDTVKATSVSLLLGSETISGEAISIYVYDSAFNIISSREFITITNQEIDILTAFSIPEVLLPPGKYVVSCKTYSDGVYMVPSQFPSDDSTVFIDPNAGGTWFTTSIVPVIRLNVSDDFWVCDLEALAICTGTYSALAIGSYGTPPYSFSWSTGDTTANITITVPVWPNIYTVTITDDSLCQATSTVSYLPCVGIEESELYGNISVYPNPNNGQFILELENVLSGNYEVNIYNALGQMVRNSIIQVNGSYSELMQLNSLEKGIYFMKVSDSFGKQITHKFSIE